MNQALFSNVPLLGALCVAAGLVSQDDVETCLALQHTTYPGTPIGQILVLKDYLTQNDLARMVAQQQSFRRTLCTSLENRFAQSVGEPEPQEAAAPSTLPELSAFTPAELDECPLFDVAS